MKIKHTDRKKVILKKEGRLTAKLFDLCDFTYEKELKDNVETKQTKPRTVR